MQEDINRPIARFFELRLQPVRPPVAEFPPMRALHGRFIDRIEKNKRPGSGVEDRLDEPVVVAGGGGKYSPESLPVVVIAAEPGIPPFFC